MRSPRSLILLLALCAVAARTYAADVIYNNGGSSRQDGMEMTQWFEADDFVLHERTQVSALKFWNYAFPGAFTGTILWEVYTNSSTNSPGVLIASGTSSSLTHAATGFVLFSNLAEFVTEFQMTPVTLEPGTYWIALHNGPREHVSRGMFWAPIAGAVAAPSHSREVTTNSPWYSNAFPLFPSDLAFQLFGTAVPRATGTGFVNGSPTVSFTSKAGKQYRLEFKNSMTESSWRAVPGREVITGTGAEMMVDDPQADAKTSPRRFYRVVVL